MHRRLAIVGVAATARAVYLFGLTDPHGVRSDAAHYHEIAANLASGRGFASTFPQLEVHATAFRPPLYPAVLGALYRVTGPSVLAGKLATLVIGLGVVVLAARLADRIGGRIAGDVAGLLVATFPPLIANDVNLLAEPLGLLLVLGVLLAIGDGRPGVAGVATGLAMLTRPSAQLLLVVVGVWLWRAKGVRIAACYAAIAVVVVAPWVVRNAVEVGTPTIVTSNGFNLAAMYSVEAQATGAFVDPVHDERFGAFRLDQFDEAGWDARMRAHGIDGLAANPAFVVTNVARNAAATFELWPPYNEGPELEDGRNLAVRKATLPFFYAVALAGIAGLWRARRSPDARLLGAVTAYFTLTSLLVLAPPRLRAPFDLACCIGAGALVASMRERSDGVGRHRLGRRHDRARAEPAGVPGSPGHATPGEWCRGR